MQSFFPKKVSRYFVGGEKALYFVFISFSISKSSVPNFCGTNYGLSIKTT